MLFDLFSVPLTLGIGVVVLVACLATRRREPPRYAPPPAPVPRYVPSKTSLARNIALALAIGVAVYGFFVLAIFVFLSFLGGIFKGSNK